tara:strand:- start:624 stop:968 length:345 start_codon:yes stop_codon:yes gene_type:complete
MAYSVNKDTKVATYNGDTYPPTQKTDAKTGNTTLVAKSEAECVEVKKIRDNYPNECLNRLREKRNNLIAQTDWWALGDITMTDAQKNYRQALRDITKTYKSIEEASGNWPTKPE